MVLSYIKKYARGDGGNLSIITSIVGLMLVTAVGASLDGGRMFSTKQKLQSITDAAALTAATPDGVTAMRREQLAKSSIKSNVEKDGGLKISSGNINVDDSKGQVYVSLTAEVPMFFGMILGNEMRRVSASSLAEESSHLSVNSLSISLVLDLSASMGDRFDNGSKLASVNMAMSDMLNSINSKFGGEVAAATRISTGVYPFNWGMVDGETVALQPGTDSVLTSMTNLSLGEGSVPTTAMERAVADQIADREKAKNRDRYIVYVTDGKVDEDKYDVAGRFLSLREIFPDSDEKKCEKIAKDLARLDRQLEPQLVEKGSSRSVLNIDADVAGVDILGDHTLDIHALGKNDDDEDNDGDDENNGNGKALGSAKHAGHTHGSQKVRHMAKRLELREEYIEFCSPEQPVRVAEACEEAREEDISIIAINLSGEDGIASNTTDMCINGVDILTAKERQQKEKGVSQLDASNDAPEGDFKTLPSGIKVRISADGRSFAGDANSLEEIRDMLSAVLPNGKAERHVRLVG